MLHEAEVQLTLGRQLRNLGDGWLLHDPTDPEPFWNRLVVPRWPRSPAAFDRRLDEVITLFATLARVPHVRPAPLDNQPSDLALRLAASGFGTVAADLRLVLTDAGPSDALAKRFDDEAKERRLSLARFPAASAGPGRGWTGDAARVLAEAFQVDPFRRVALEADLLACAARPGCVVLVLYEGGEPVATARATTAKGGTYLSSIGTRTSWRGRGYGATITALAVVAALRAPRRRLERAAPIIHLAVDVGNGHARELYERLGFRVVGEAVPDLLAR
jgi:ribosomal protein S18 acetylase RimI-like enzyme